MDKQRQQPDVVDGDFVCVRGDEYQPGRCFPWWTPEKHYQVIDHPSHELGVYADDGDFYSITGECLAGNGRFEKVTAGDCPPITE